MQVALKILPRCSETSNVLSNTCYVVQSKKQIAGLFVFYLLHLQEGWRENCWVSTLSPELALRCTNSPSLIFLSSTGLVISKDVKHLIFIPFNFYVTLAIQFTWNTTSLFPASLHCVSVRVFYINTSANIPFYSIALKWPTYLISTLDTESFYRSERNIYSDSPVPSHGSEGGTEKRKKKKKRGKGCKSKLLSFLPSQRVLFKAFGIPAVWMCRFARWQRDLLGMWATIVSAFRYRNHVEWWQWVSSPGGRQWPGRVLPKGHEDCSDPAQAVDPGC